jgi:hypothetical protein
VCTQVDVWYESTDGSTPLRISSTQTQNAPPHSGWSQTISTLTTKEILEWDVTTSIGPSVFAHCTPNTTATTA